MTTHRLSQSFTEEEREVVLLALEQFACSSLPADLTEIEAAMRRRDRAVAGQVAGRIRVAREAA